MTSGPRRLPAISVPYAVCVMWSALLLGGCGELTNKERIVIAEIDGEPVTRGDLQEYIRFLNDDARPEPRYTIVQRKSDVLRMLHEFIDIQVTDPIANRLKSEGKITVDRDQLRAEYLARNPDKGVVYLIADPAEAGFTVSDVEAMKTIVEFAVDELEEAALRELALAYLAGEIVRRNPRAISEDDFRRAYDARKDELETFETVSFVGLRFPAADPAARRETADIRNRIRQGESFDAVFNEYVDRDENFGVRSGLQNNPNAQKFRQFWNQVSGVPAGEIVGPVFMSEYRQTNADGQAIQVPPTWAVIKILTREPPRPMTFEEAKRPLSVSILRQRVIEGLRADNGVLIYEDKLWDPAGYGDQFEGQFIEVNE